MRLTEIRPEISADDQDTILELLCKYGMSWSSTLHSLTSRTSLLSPIGQHRRAHIKPSRGKREDKRSKKEPSAEATTTALSTVKPPKPELCSHVDVGFNAITREFESLSVSNTTKQSELNTPRQPYSMVFVTRGNQSAAFNCHFPKMVAAASQKLGPQNNIRLVGFSKPCSDRLSSCLGIARVSSLAISRDAPGVEVLWSFVKEHVPQVEAAWLEATERPQYKPTQIDSVETVVGVKRTKTGQPA